jgi:hypothetical protein
MIGNATTSRNAERWRHVNRRMNCEGGVTRGNATISRRVERWLQPEGRTKRMSGGGNVITSQTRGTGGHGAMRVNGAMRGGDAGRWEAAA